eukprot:CAMPEP_0202904676 /NCGR_PEP_ID=MMETSP1392-20130828/30593_1 /ASSEMBLY_ACC=CAM_ASM_000868 /TAXON_ID=225041 /ORGANISM="Chlamydomonas chlamydogama, Strain SAG 11-48b" /LENGTH=558 /DNA_ID=CAMNT_0049592433 /DNA_START=449 /DNA_END=2125 /DNA_ORIENTATION=-
MARSTFDDFKILEKVGSGSYGVVYKVVRKVDRMTYAMKEIELQGMSRKEQEECIRETRVLSSLDSDFIIKYYDSFLERGKLYIITEYASNGNLHDYIKRQKSRLPEDLIWKLFEQILLGLNHMHSKKILHRDIKTLNVFLDDGLNVKLGDMGVAKILSTNTNFAKTIVGTPYYLSPELCEDKPYNEKSDVWALGVVLYECCTQRHPFDADNQGALILKILRGKYPPVTGYSPDIAELIKRCLTQNANRRPTTFKLLMLPSVRQKADELGVALPDVQTLQATAERLQPKRVQSARQRPPTGNMDAPPPIAAEVAADQQGDAAASGAGNDDKAFVFGSTIATRQRSQVDVEVSGVEVTPGEVDGDAGSAAPPLEAKWRVAQDDAAQVAQRMGGLAIDDEPEEEEDDENNPYHNPHAYRDPNDPDDLAGEEGSYDEEELGEEDQGEVYADDAGEEDDEEGYFDEEGEEGEDGDGPWQPSPQRVQHMRAALMIQKAACLDLIGEKPFNELYNLLKSNQVDEASMTDLSRLVFKIIPYDKSEVIQMMYKLLYLEGQLEHAAPA